MKGSYQSPSYEVEADIPSKLPKMSPELPKNRLGLSKWIFDKKSIDGKSSCKQILADGFWRGIVNTPGDFGVQGNSHLTLIYLNIFLTILWKKTGISGIY